MRTLIVTLIVFCLSTIGTSQAQSPTRLRGTIASSAGDVLSVKSNDGKTAAVRLTDRSEIVFTRPMRLSEIRPGDFLAVTSTKQNDGTLTAFEVRRFPKPLNPGHRPFGNRDDQTMTNATVAVMVESAAGRELTLTYEGGSQKIIVPEKAAISMLVPGERSQLVPNAAVMLTAAPGADGRLTALRIQVSPPREGTGPV